MSRMWQKHNTLPGPRVLARADHPQLAGLDDWLQNEDAPRTISPAPPPPPDRHIRRVDLGNSAGLPWVVNPPTTRIRRGGEVAQFTGEPQPKREQINPLRAELGAEYFDDDHEIETASSPIADDRGTDKPVGIAELAKRLERKPDSIRRWIDAKIIPEAPMRTGGKVYTSGLGTTTTTCKRLWPAAEADALVRIAAQEHILSKPRQPINSTDFSARAWEARTKQQMHDDRGKPNGA